MALINAIGKLSKHGCRFYSDSVKLNDVYILSAARTPHGKFGGKLASLSAVDLGSIVLKAAVEKSKVPKEDIGELVFGAGAAHGLGQSPDHQILCLAGLPETIISSSVSKLCGTGMKLIMNAAQLIACDIHHVVAVTGAESPSNFPYLLKRRNPKYGDLTLFDSLNHELLVDPFEKVDVTSYAEVTAKKNGFTKEAQDEYAMCSYTKACAAQEKGRFDDEMTPVVIKTKRKEETLDKDETIQAYDPEKLKKAKTKGDDTITSVNSSSLADGAAAMILASGKYVQEKKLKPLAKIVAWADAQLEAKEFCNTPTLVIPKVLCKACIDPQKIDLWEINETFALTPMLCIKALNLDPEKVNIHGGAIVLGHPFGASGVRIVGHLAHNLCPGEVGCTAIQHANGGASSLILEKCS